MAFWTLRLYHKQTLKCATITAEVNQKETKNGYVCANAGDYAHDGQDIQQTNVEEMPLGICRSVMFSRCISCTRANWRSVVKVTVVTFSQNFDFTLF